MTHGSDSNALSSSYETGSHCSERRSDKNGFQNTSSSFIEAFLRARGVGWGGGKDGGGRFDVGIVIAALPSKTLNAYSTHVLHMRSTCTVHVLYMYSTCATHVQWLISLC